MTDKAMTGVGAGMRTGEGVTAGLFDTRLEATTRIVTAYLSTNPMPPEAVADFMATIYQTVSRIQSGDFDESAHAKPVPAIPVEDSVTDDLIYCLEDGQGFKSLKRHLRSKYDLTPEAYREKWGLPLDYPMVAPNYTKARSELARKSGLGRNRALHGSP